MGFLKVVLIRVGNMAKWEGPTSHGHISITTIDRATIDGKDLLQIKT